ncbi:MAG: hypothetical protein CXZ00_12485 [Acidobacteria bacterium]|nr:MAG: hypothetical protein CXZ00_12485 [Acidobacteriota bacterium]
MNTVITELIASYGYVILFLLVGLESLGIPLPGETALIIAAAYAAAGHLSISTVIATAALAAILGDNGGYWVGRRGGLALIRRYGRFVRLDEAKIDRVHGFFHKHGAKTVFVGRFIALLRTWAAVLAGVGEMKYSTFTLFNITGGITWAVFFGTLGYTFGRNLPKLEHLLGQISFVVTFAVALSLIFFLGARWVRAHSGEFSERVSNFGERIANSRGLKDFRARYPRAWSLIVQRFDPTGHLGLHLTLGLIISFGALWFFGGVIEDVVHNDPITQLDFILLDWFHTHVTPSTFSIFRAISWLGAPSIILVLGVLVGLVLVLRQRWILLAGWTAALAGAALLDVAVKEIIQRPRPIYADYFSEYSYSFPSGHAMGSLVCYGMLAYLFVIFFRRNRRVQGAIAFFAVFLIAAIGLSRLCLGVHYFSDVIAGYSGGAFWLSSCVTVLEIARRQSKMTLHH